MVSKNPPYLLLIFFIFLCVYPSEKILCVTSYTANSEIVSPIISKRIVGKGKKKRKIKKHKRKLFSFKKNKIKQRNFIENIPNWVLLGAVVLTGGIIFLMGLSIGATTLVDIFIQLGVTFIGLTGFFITKGFLNETVSRAFLITALILNLGLIGFMLLILRIANND